MKILTMLVTTVLISLNLFAQYSTPNTGVRWTLDSLVSHSGGSVTNLFGNYCIEQDLTISINDTLLLYNNDSIKISDSKLITIYGRFISNPSQEIVFTAMDTTLLYKGFRFENSNQVILKNITFEFGGGIKLISSNVNVEGCIFRKNSSTYASGAIDIFQCNPVIRNSQFYLNSRSAIMSSATAQASPHILNNLIWSNCTSNTNYPQINLGNYQANHPIVVCGNTITGLYEMAGGVALSTLAGGEIHCIIDSNVIRNNRYGIALLGNNISSIVSNNLIENNNIQNQPMQGGSGININGNTTNISKIYRNRINGNLWGITLQGNSVANLGSIDQINVGQNIIFGNANSGSIYNLYNNTPIPQDAMFNYWGTYNMDSVALGIFDYSDNNALGVVDCSNIQQKPVNVPYYRFTDSVGVWSVNLEKFAIDGDTIINTKSYRKVYHHEGYQTYLSQFASYIAAVREDTLARKVFVVPENDQTEYLLYDFNLRIGDTTQVMSYPTIFNNYWHWNFVVIKNIDSTNIGESYRKRWIVAKSDYDDVIPEFWIEGIGSSRGILFSGEPILLPVKNTIGYPYLLCYHQEDDLVYDVFPDLTCYEVPTIFDVETQDQLCINIYPSIVENFMTIHFREAVPYDVLIYNIFGQSVYNLKNQTNEYNQINISKLTSGIYIVNIKGVGINLSQKIIKLK